MRIRGPTTKVHQHPLYLNLKNLTRSAVLTWVSIYWFSRAGPTASVRIYYESANAQKGRRIPQPSVPIGLSFFPKESLQAPRVCVSTVPFLIYSMLG